jgi:OFA family oxalate/formate antiporter-like MFS transporter
MKRWAVLFAGVAIQMILGGVYAWSEFVPKLIAEYGLSKGQCGMIFGATIATFTVVMIPAGRILQKYGPRITAAVGAVLFTLGYVLASMTGGDFMLLFVSLSIIAGAGIGFGYICPLTVGMKWFPNNKGLVTGVSVAGFGGGAVLVSNVAEYLLQDLGIGVMEVFRIIGIGSGLVAFLSAMIMSLPPGEKKQASIDAETRQLVCIFKTPTFLLIVFGMFCGTFAGLLVVGNLKPLALSLGMSGSAATLSISLFALGNAGGRILWGKIHDAVGSYRAIIFSLASLGISLVLVPISGSGLVLQAAIFLVGMGFGA